MRDLVKLFVDFITNVTVPLTLLLLKVALYLIPAVGILYCAGFLCGLLLSVATRIVAKVDISLASATHMMAFVVGVTVGVSLAAFQLAAGYWAMLAIGAATAFLVGTCVYSQTILDVKHGNRKPRMAGIGLPKAAIISAVLTVAGLVAIVLLLGLRSRRE